MVKKHAIIPKLNISNTPIDFVFQYKYLGVTIDEILSFNAHLNNTIKLVSHKILLLHKIRYYITEDTAIRIVHDPALSRLWRYIFYESKYYSG